ncbi:MAG: inositol monophosphatase family protein [Rhizobiales bacterium]|nr:inositol monophosphatase family protein [Hyphomicrobiales bacterium]
MTNSQTDALVSFAHGLADAADQAILPLFRSGLNVENKLEQGFDPVTAADQASERVMRERIGAQYPDHGILGEEFGTEASAHPDGLTWVLDPIDGTRAFICGMPTWMTLIGLCDAQKALGGVASQAYTGERFYADTTGAWHRDRAGNKTQLQVRPARPLEEAIFCSTVPDHFSGALEQPYQTLKSRAKLTRAGGDAYIFCLLAAGCIDLVIDPGLQPYDIAALVPIIEQAGGVVTTLEGAPAHNGGDIIAAASAELHEEVCALFAA